MGKDVFFWTLGIAKIACCKIGSPAVSSSIVTQSASFTESDYDKRPNSFLFTQPECKFERIKFAVACAMRNDKWYRHTTCHTIVMVLYAQVGAGCVDDLSAKTTTVLPRSVQLSKRQQTQEVIMENRFEDRTTTDTNTDDITPTMSAQYSLVEKRMVSLLFEDLKVVANV